jgi:hypothetical protein
MVSTFGNWNSRALYKHALFKQQILDKINTSNKLNKSQKPKWMPDGLQFQFSRFHIFIQLQTFLNNPCHSPQHVPTTTSNVGMLSPPFTISLELGTSDNLLGPCCKLRKSVFSSHQNANYANKDINWKSGKSDVLSCHLHEETKKKSPATITPSDNLILTSIWDIQEPTITTYVRSETWHHYTKLLPRNVLGY